MGQFMDLDVRGFLDELASSSPAPGGGSVAAYSLCLGAALVEMVCALTIGRKKYADVQDAMVDLQQQAHTLRGEADTLVQSDADAYNAVMAAFGMPKDTDEEKAARKQAIADATHVASVVPHTTALLSLKLYGMALQALELGNTNAASDAFVATHLAHTGGMAALANVRINLSGLGDADQVAVLTKEIEAIETDLSSYYQKAMLLSKVKIGG